MSDYEERPESDQERRGESEEPAESRIVSTSMSLGRYLSMYEAIIQPPTSVGRY